MKRYGIEKEYNKLSCKSNEWQRLRREFHYLQGEKGKNLQSLKLVPWTMPATKNSRNTVKS